MNALMSRAVKAGCEGVEEKGQAFGLLVIVLGG